MGVTSRRPSEEEADRVIATGGKYSRWCRHVRLRTAIVGITLAALLGALAIFALPASADTVIARYTQFTGRNIYSPDVLYDSRIDNYVMWSGGWQSSVNGGHDYIYYRESTNHSPNSWGAPQTAIVPADIGSNVSHVNDPSVTEFANGVTGQVQYTMFFTVCMSPCIQGGDNQIWSAVSNNGISWTGYQVLLSGESSGPADPSALYTSSGSGVWLVYYANRLGNCNDMNAAVVDGSRGATSISTVFSVSSGCVSAPSVANFTDAAGDWHLFYDGGTTVNVFDIYEAKSSSDLSWKTSSLLIANSSSGPICGTATPFALPAGGQDYELYFGELAATSAGCTESDNFTSIQGWIMAGVKPKPKGLLGGLL